MMIIPRSMNDFTDSDVQRLIEMASRRFGGREYWVIRVPARLCLAADHTDYWEAFTPELVTFASDSATMKAVISPRTDSMVRMFNVGDFEDCEFDLDEGAPPRATGSNGWLDWLDAKGTPSAHWSNYVRGSVHHAQMHHDVTVGFDLLIDSNIPPASGASSSSALATCGSIAIRLVNNLPLERRSLVEEIANAEWYVGTRGGMMDHATMMFAEAGKMLRLTFRPFSAQVIDSSTQLANYRFVTIFTHPSDKGRAIQLAFNARALAARDVVPQMLAESTGKSGVGIVPLAGESFEQISDCVFVSYLQDLKIKTDDSRVVVQLPYLDPVQIGAEFARWEFATAVAGHILGIQPFDQKNVQEAKDATLRVLEGVENNGDAQEIGELLRNVTSSDYLALLCWLPRTQENLEKVQNIKKWMKINSVQLLLMESRVLVKQRFILKLFLKD